MSGNYTYYNDGVYLRFQVKQDGVVKTFADVFEIDRLYLKYNVKGKYKYIKKLG